MRSALIMALATTFIIPVLGYTNAAAQDISPTLLIQTAPSDTDGYRRMIHVKYLRGNTIERSFVAYNRTEFKRVDQQAPQEAIDKCANGAATSLADITAFGRDEARRATSRQTPETRFFCIKNVPNWTRINRDRYLDPIFATMPVSVQAF